LVEGIQQMPDAASRPKTILEIILEWSADRPMWQRDALRRIVQAQKLTETDLSELVALCKRGNTPKPAPTDPEAKPLEAAHLPANPGTGASVALTAIKDVSAVNNLAPAQNLTFAPKGITVVYGDNAAGKSGYARILKRACRARHSEAILSNVYGEPATTAASATLCYTVDGAAQPSEAWKDTGSSQPQPHPVLSAISVFDADCAAVHLKTRNEVAFRPFGLDVPDELADACKRVKAALDAEKQQLERARNAVFSSPPRTPSTAVGRALATLTHSTDVGKLETLATLTEQEEARLIRLTDDLSKNPATAAAEQRLKAERIKRLGDSLTVIATRTGDAAFERLLSLHQDAIAKRTAARLAAQDLFARDSLREVGGEVWRNLWEAARRYSTEIVYPDALFPPDGPDKLCVLCQQPLSAEAVGRMKRFESFIRDDTERQAQEAETKLETATRTLTELTIKLQPVAESLKEIELHDRTLARAIRRALASARARRYAAQQRIAGNDKAIIPTAEPFPIAQIAALEADTRKYAVDLQNAATRDERKVLQAERQELADRETLRAQLPTINAEISRLQSIQFLDQCLADTTTNTITTLGNRIGDQVLTPRLRDQFFDEIIKMAGRSVRVEMVRVGGQYGSPQYQVRLLAAPATNVTGVLSEGEQTCVAIAAFLAELATASHSSALVFDDPISSLDHKWRDRVAQRLVAEAAVRQVIVFTHDLVFLNDIEDAAEHAGLSCETRHIRPSATAVGMVNADLPWEGMRLRERIHKLQQRTSDLAPLRAQGNDDTYKQAARHFYDDLRAAWERALEEVAFAHVIMRHRDQIKPKDLHYVSALTRQDCQLWANNFDKCCGHMAGHDQSRGRNRATPEPDELLQDAQALATWVRDLQDRQKTLVQASSGLPVATAAEVTAISR
jgi:energy-coupling factor transporter ATP-binding protein EcfA2